MHNGKRRKNKTEVPLEGQVYAQHGWPQKSLCFQVTHKAKLGQDVSEMTQIQALRDQTMNSEFILLSGSGFQVEVGSFQGFLENMVSWGTLSISITCDIT